MRLATIDCGTNTVLLLVADADLSLPWRPGALPPLCLVEDRLEITRLGEDMDQSGELSPAAMERTLSALERHARRARELGTERLVAVGTEALRAPKNGAAFLDRAARAGVPIIVLGSDEEAILSFRSAVSFLPARRDARGYHSVLDIGGGSTELIVGRSLPEEHRSVPIGSVRLTERFLKSDPPAPAERQALRQAIEAAFHELPAPRGELIGVAGTCTTLCAMYLGLDTYDGTRVDGTRLPVDALAALSDRLFSLPLSERRALRGLDPRRADVICAGAQILLCAALRAAVDHITISDRGVRWGVMMQLLDELAATNLRGTSS